MCKTVMHLSCILSVQCTALRLQDAACRITLSSSLHDNHLHPLSPPPLPFRLFPACAIILRRRHATTQRFACRGRRHGMHASSQQLDHRAATASVAVASDREDEPAGCCADVEPRAAGSNSSRKRDAPGPSVSPEKRDPNGRPALCCAALRWAVMI